MSDHGSPGSRQDGARETGKRLDDFESRLREARKGQDAAPAARSSHREMGLAYRVMIEMVVGLAFGAGIGWMLDSWLGTRPLAMVAMTLLGFAAGLRNAWRTSRSLANDARAAAGGQQAGAPRQDARPKDDGI